jgi:hypothetical protein
MKKKKTKPVKAAGRMPRRPLMIITAIAVVAIAAITVVSRQSASQAEGPGKVRNAMATAENAKYAKVKLAGQDLQVDSQGKIRPLTTEEAKQLADGLKTMLNKSTDGLVEEYNADGSVSVDLQGRFQNVVVARENQDGTVSTSCVDNPKAAGKFFGIDPKLLENR